MRGAAALALIALLGCAAAPCRAQPLKLPPADEAAGDPSWMKFKAQLLAAAQNRDRRFLLSVLDAKVRNAAGTAPGVAEFRRQWDLDAADSPLWSELPKILFLGGRYIGGPRGARELCAPYVAFDWPEQFDRFEHGAIVSREALVKARPASDSATLATLSYEVVAVLDWDVADEAAGFPQRWVKVRVGAGDGYVPEEQIRSPVEHRACFVKTGAGWRISALLAGE